MNMNKWVIKKYFEHDNDNYDQILTKWRAEDTDVLLTHDNSLTWNEADTPVSYIG